MGIFRLIGLFSIVPGTSHLSLQAYSHFGVYFYLVSFVAIGIIQIILGIRVWKGELSNRAFWAATLINGIATVFWILTRIMYAPFMGGTEHFSIIGVAVGSLQILFIIILCLRRASIRDAVIVIVLSVVLGFAAHTGAMFMEKLFPALAGTGSHSHGHGEENSSEGMIEHNDSEEEHMDDDHHDEDIQMHEEGAEVVEKSEEGETPDSDSEAKVDDHKDGSDALPHGHE